MQAFQQGVTTTKTGPDLNTFGICYTELCSTWKQQKMYSVRSAVSCVALTAFSHFID